MAITKFWNWRKEDTKALKKMKLGIDIQPQENSYLTMDPGITSGSTTATEIMQRLIDRQMLDYMNNQRMMQRQMYGPQLSSSGSYNSRVNGKWPDDGPKYDSETRDALFVNLGFTENIANDSYNMNLTASINIPRDSMTRTDPQRMVTMQLEEMKRKIIQEIDSKLIINKLTRIDALEKNKE